MTPISQLSETHNVRQLSTFFVFRCPLRQCYAVCVVDYAGRYYAAPGWRQWGHIEYTDNGGSGWYTWEDCDNTSYLWQAGDDMLHSGEQIGAFAEPPDTPATNGTEDIWLPLGNHDRATFSEEYLRITDIDYEQWKRICDLGYGKRGSHDIVVRAARRLHKKRQAILRRRKAQKKEDREYVQPDV